MLQQVSERNQARMKTEILLIFDSPEFVTLEDYTSLYFFIKSIYKGDFYSTTKKL